MADVIRPMADLKPLRRKPGPRTGRDRQALAADENAA